MDVSVIYVNYNCSNLTINSIKSVIELTNDICYEIIVVDNNSTPNEKNIIEDYCNTNNIKLIKSNSNLGFGKANNLATKYASGKYLFFLNPDTYLINNAIKELFSFASNNDVTACGANLFSKQLKPIHSYWMLMPSISNEISTLLCDIPLKIKHKNSYEHNHSKSPIEVAFTTGADLMIKQSIFKEMNGFDDSFFMYFEETDLQYRIKKIGHKIYNLPKAKIVHLESQTLQSRTKKLELFFNSRKIFYHKHYSNTYLYTANIILILTCISRIILFSILFNKEKIFFWKTTLKQCL